MNQFYKRDRDENAEPLKAIIYCRVSSIAQTKKGDGLASQESRCREYAAYKGYIVVKVVYDRAVSGGLFDRPGIKEVIQFLKREKHAEQYVVVFDDIILLQRDQAVVVALAQGYTPISDFDVSSVMLTRQQSHDVFVTNFGALLTDHEFRPGLEIAFHLALGLQAPRCKAFESLLND
ncbi:recombinase family protein [uncultured Devosia sp.]|uniref:recombinase family protein n=1 Tax=uncultured Devosia sp. TaxID=211434 RepID=UPI0035CBA159